MQRTGISYRIISLLALVVVLAIAWGLDRLLANQQKWAAASFNYFQLFGITILSVLILIALWFGLGWLTLFMSGYSRLVWITFLIVGLFWTLVLYVAAAIHWFPGRMPIIVTLQGSSAMVRSTGMFISALGLLNLALHSRFRRPRSRSGN